MLWGHPALIPALLLAESFGQQGAKMKLGTVMGVGDIAYYVYVGPDGDQVALPCTERLYTERQAVVVTNYGVMPLLSLRGRPELRLGSFASLAGPALAGFWAPVTITPQAASAAAPAPVVSGVVATAAEAEPAEEPAAEPAAADDTDLDALLASLGTPAPAEEAPAAEAAPEEAGMDDLDALLASLNAPPEPPAADDTEQDLDALLASLK